MYWDENYENRYDKRVFHKGHSIRESRYIMEMHLGRPLTRGEVVHHIDGDYKNNKLENLKVMLAGKHTTMHLTGKKNNAQLTASQVGQIKRLIKEDVPMTEIAREYEMSCSTIYSINAGTSWSEITAV